MERVFENVSNGHRETVDGGDRWGVFFLGIFYLAYKGLWAHVFIWLLVLVIPTMLGGAPALVFTLPAMAIGYCIGIPELLANRYLREGWKEVGTAPSRIPAVAPHDAVRYQEHQPRTVGHPDSIFRPGGVGIEPLAPSKPTFKSCPFCAEEVKYEAIKCKHCQSDLVPVASGDA